MVEIVVENAYENEEKKCEGRDKFLGGNIKERGF